MPLPEPGDIGVAGHRGVDRASLGACERPTHEASGWGYRRTLAFCDAPEANGSAVQVLGDETRRGIARECVDTGLRDVTIDRTTRESVRAKLRAMVRRILRKHGYPPDKQEKATVTVLEQAEVLSEGWRRPEFAVEGLPFPTGPTGTSIRRFLILSSLVGQSVPYCELSAGRSGYREPVGDRS